MDHVSIGDYLELVLPYIDPILAPSPYLDFLRFIAGQFPAAITRCIVLECRLGTEESRVDLLFVVTRSERDVLSRQGPFLMPGQAPLNQQAWSRVEEFITTWAQPDSELYRNVKSLTFEFDIHNPPNEYPVPGFFFGSKRIQSAGSLSAGTNRWVFQSALPTLLDNPLPRSVEKTLLQCINCLPTGAHLFQIGVFYSRLYAPLRICLTGIPPEDIVPYLRKIGYSEDLAEFGEIVKKVSPFCEIHLDLDIDENVSPKIGLSCSQDRHQFLRLAQRDARLMDFLVEMGWCTQEKRTASLAYPGFMNSIDYPDRWSPGLLSHPFHPESGLASTIRRDLMLVKIVYEPGSPVQAKLYLQATHAWLSKMDAVKQGLVFSARDKDVINS